MTIQLTEPTVTALVAKLSAGLNAKIDEVNSAVTDGYPIDYPAAILDYVPPVGVMPAFPIVCISDGNVFLEDDTGFGATGVFDLTIVIYIQNVDQRALAWQLRRYAQAVARCALDQRRIGTAAWGVVLNAVRSGPTLARDESPREFLSTVAITITCKTEQDTP